MQRSQIRIHAAVATVSFLSCSTCRIAHSMCVLIILILEALAAQNAASRGNTMRNSKASKHSLVLVQEPKTKAPGGPKDHNRLSPGA